MEQAVVKSGKRTGWSSQESALLWETAEEAQKQGLPLKQVFERIAGQTGRRPNSIRNYYYAQVRDQVGADQCAARFVPFTDTEVNELMEHVLRARARGQSVRSCLQQLSHGDHSLMLRYQNKYRSVLKARPELVRRIVEELNREGVACEAPQVHSRARSTLDDACRQLSASARQVGDQELARACEVLTRAILSGRPEQGAQPAKAAQEEAEKESDRLNVRLDLYRLAMTRQSDLMRRLSETATELTGELKEFLVLGREQRTDKLDRFCEVVTEQIGSLESLVTDSERAQARIELS